MPTCGLLSKRYRIFTDRLGMPYPTGITLKCFYYFIHRCYAVTALCFMWFSLPNSRVSCADFRVLGFNSIESFTTAQKGTPTQRLQTKTSIQQPKPLLYEDLVSKL